MSETGIYNEPLLTEEERQALENIMLEEGLSDSDSVGTFWVEKSLQEKKKKSFIGPPVPKNRDGLGYYVPPPGHKPLTSLQEPTPGPQYDPDYTKVKTTYPMFTLANKPMAPRPKKQFPAPNKYNTQGSLVWTKCKRFPIMAKRKDVKPAVSPGPETAKMKPFKATGPKFSMGKRCQKPPAFNSLVMPEGEDSPGPAYNEPTGAWLDKPTSFGAKIDSKVPGRSPGPAKYTAGMEVTASCAPSFSFGKRNKKSAVTPGPGPARYKLATTVGKSPKAPFGVYHVIPDPQASIPGPDIYHRAGFQLDEPGYTMKYRWMDSEPEITPGPADYEVHKVPPPRGPAFSLKGKSKPKAPAGTPAPNQYKYGIDPISSAGRGRSFGVRWKHLDKKDTVPTDYPDLETSNKLLPSIPTYSFQQPPKEPVLCKFKTPAPNRYRPRDLKTDKTITIGHDDRNRTKATAGPGPAPPIQISAELDPVCFPCESNTGATLKGRHSPFKYVGLSENARTRPSPKETNCLPLLG